jgi:hypothetical protein
LYFSFLGKHAQATHEKGKAIVYVGKTFVIGLLARPDMVDVAQIEEEVKKTSTCEVKVQKRDTLKFDPKKKGVKPIVTKGIL